MPPPHSACNGFFNDPFAMSVVPGEMFAYDFELPNAKKEQHFQII